MAKRVFISFDYDNDSTLKDFLVGQSRNSDSPFSIADWSIKQASPGWEADARRRIRACDVVAVICGHNTNTATGVARELSIAQEEGIPYFLLAGYREGKSVKPTTAKPSDSTYNWTWDNLKILIGGGR